MPRFTTRCVGLATNKRKAQTPATARTTANPARRQRQTSSVRKNRHPERPRQEPKAKRHATRALAKHSFSDAAGAAILRSTV